MFKSNLLFVSVVLLFGCAGIAYGEKGLYNREIEDYTKAIQINPKNAKAYNSRGTVYYSKGLYDKAIEDYTKAIQINPQYAEAY